MTCILFSRPEHDTVLAYLFYYSKKLVNLAVSNGYKTINKERKDANKLVISSVIKKQVPDLIMFNGHGSPYYICGHNNEVIISNDNVELLDKK